MQNYLSKAIVKKKKRIFSLFVTLFFIIQTLKGNMLKEKFYFRHLTAPKKLKWSNGKKNPTWSVIEWIYFLDNTKSNILLGFFPSVKYIQKNDSIKLENKFELGAQNRIESKLSWPSSRIKLIPAHTSDHFEWF